MFPTINHLNDLLPHIQHNPQIRVKVESTGHTVVCYMLQDEDTFDGEGALFARECRGITFHPDGSIAARTLDKFFNVGQTEEVNIDKLPWREVTRCMTKRDGSMITPVSLNKEAGTWKMKTKKSFDTKEALLAEEVAMATPGGGRWISQLLQDGFTPTFEITSPKFPIVLLYEKDELTLLHVRKNSTGRYLTEAELNALNSPFPLVENVSVRFLNDAGITCVDKLKHFAETAEKTEGLVIQFSSGQMVKLKTKWYCELHRSVVFVRERDVAELALNDKFDDLLGAFALLGKDQSGIRSIANRAKEKVNAIKSIVTSLIADGKSRGAESKKDWAMAFKGHPQFSLLMAEIDKKEVDYNAWYLKHYLKNDFSLDVVLDEAN